MTAVTNLKQLIAQAEDVPFEDVEIPEWGGAKVRIKGLNSEQIDQYEAKQIALSRRDTGNDTEVRMRNHRAELVAQVLFDPETDTRVFPDVKEGARVLSKRSSGIVNGLFVLTQKLSGMDREFGQKVDDAKADFSEGQNS